ncbi:DEAD/DEAH box helicase [Cryobacterium luteum]|uniref:Helicase n=1 Tax=Cryobacterium luteum TaxID=1424661 RepID=A0A1H8MDP4_9MICO|nr:DEAD/DEAH box helicase [Cryobacterium luteum]TFB94327.1 helicase [Cryobacterium luteum]SEO15481.1 Superfamily II DNA or RNA helicase, SNF2 family [Cryobacterium luteum]
MAHSLSTHEIARIVGSQSFSRGERYARNGHVTEQSWAPSGTHLTGRVSGTSPQPYTVLVSFTLNAAGQAVRASGTCTCPMGSNCKHVAALLLASRSTPAERTASNVRAIGDHRTPVFESTFVPAAYQPPSPAPVIPIRPPVPAWRAALAPIAKPSGSETATSTALALQFDLLEPAYSPNRRPQPRRLGARPMVMGKKGKWIRGSLTWDNLSWTPGTYNRGHRKILNALYALSATGQRYYSYTDHWLYLDNFENKALWDLLHEAQLSGLPMVCATDAQNPVLLSPTPAALELDIRRDDEGLQLTPLLLLNERLHRGAEFGFLGDPAHGAYTFTSPIDPLATGRQLVLAPLNAQVSSEIRALAVTGGLHIPADDEAAFLADYYPFLQHKLTLTSHDASFELPKTARPLLALAITHQTDARITLAWEWQYVAPTDTSPATAATDDQAAPVGAPGAAASAGGTTGAGNAAEIVAAAVAAQPVLYRHPLRPTPGDTRFRDLTREADTLRKLERAIRSFEPLWQPATPISAARLLEHSELRGAVMINFLEHSVPLLADAGIVVQVSADAPSYREADEAPVISLATTESTDTRDWFDLAVTVSIEGEDIPFDDLFRALATDQDLMILDSGTYFSLDRPELQQLRRLIEEARGLQESNAGTLGLSRFQADLWDELQLLGVVAEQSAAWRSAVEGLSEAAPIAERPLPPAVHATLRAYQQTGFDWLSFLYDHQLGGVLADDMGLGKTLQAIALIAHARDSQRAEPGAARKPFLVVAPTSVVSNWATECARFAPDLTTAAITQTAGKRGSSLKDVMGEADVVITSYTLFRLDFEEYNAQDWAGLLLDEAQFVKNHQSKAHVCARRLRTPFKLAITGTPMENNLMELWSLLSITAPGLFPSPSRFADYYRKPIETDADVDRLAQLRRRIRPFMLRRTKAEVASDLPEKQEQVLELDLHPRHRKVYDMHLARERQKVLGLIEDMNANRFEIFRSLTMLRQLSLDASLYDAKYDSVPSTKLDALLELLEDTVAEGHRTLIFSQFTQYLGKARDRLDAAGISYSYLDGKTRNRAKAISDFKEGSSSVFLISLKAGGFGLNLTEADYVILLDPWWNPATEAQAVDRVHRIGQTKNVMVYRLVSKDTIEEKVMALKATKARLFESVMTDGAPAGTALTAADIRELLA